MNFKIGDTVICINASQHQTLRKGKLYTVQSVSACVNCKAVVLDVGLKLNGVVKKHYCLKCKSYAQHTDSDKSFAFADRFVKLEDLLADVRWKKEMTREVKLMTYFNAPNDTLFPIESGEN